MEKPPDIFTELESGSEFHRATRTSGCLMLEPADDSPKSLKGFQLIVRTVQQIAISRGFKFKAHESALHEYGYEAAWLYSMPQSYRRASEKVVLPEFRDGKSSAASAHRPKAHVDIGATFVMLGRASPKAA